MARTTTIQRLSEMEILLGSMVNCKKDLEGTYCTTSPRPRMAVRYFKAFLTEYLRLRDEGVPVITRAMAGDLDDVLWEAAAHVNACPKTIPLDVLGGDLVMRIAVEGNRLGFLPGCGLHCRACGWYGVRREPRYPWQRIQPVNETEGTR